MIKEEQYYHILQRLEKLETKVRKLEKNNGSDPFKNDFMMYDTYNSKIHKKDKSSYKLDGLVFDKRNLVLYVVKRIVNIANPKSIKELMEMFPQETQGSLGVLLVEDIACNYKDYKKRFFTSPEDRIYVEDNTFYVCKDWTSKNIKEFINLAKKYGLEIETLNDRRNIYE